MDPNQKSYCSDCGAQLEPVYFKEYQYDKNECRTGYVRTAVDYLICPNCLKTYIIDDDTTSKWYYDPDSLYEDVSDHYDLL